MIINSKEVEEHRKRFKELRRLALNRIRGNELGRGSSSGERNHKGRAIRKIRVRRRDSYGRLVEEDVDLHDDSDSSEETRFLHKKKKRKDVWVGESFDIGREFLPAPKSRDDTREPEGVVDQLDGGTTPARPKNPTRSTHDTFVTAHTQFTGEASTSRLSLPAENGYHLESEHSQSTAPSLLVSSPAFRDSQASSTRPLIGGLIGDNDNTSAFRALSRGKIKDVENGSSKSTHAAAGLKKRLKSAIRTSGSPVRLASTSPRSISNGTRHRDSPTKAKTVHFPVGSPRTTPLVGTRYEPPRKGNKAPADPEAVLARAGDDAVGTSAGAAEEAMEDDDEEEDLMPGEVIMRGKLVECWMDLLHTKAVDRMLVRVAYHRENDLRQFDETSQVRGC